MTKRSLARQLRHLKNSSDERTN